MELKNILQVENLKFKFKYFGDIFDVAPSTGGQLTEFHLTKSVDRIF
jgi:hypothetical protein